MERPIACISTGCRRAAAILSATPGVSTPSRSTRHSIGRTGAPPISDGRNRVPDDFRFAVKVPKAITHEAGLADCGALLDRFVDEVTGLGDKLGVLLVQLPPKSALSKRVADRFFRDLRARIDTDVVLEPRHASWLRRTWTTGWRNAASRASPPIRRRCRRRRARRLERARLLSLARLAADLLFRLRRCRAGGAEAAP